jgi:hypothetical protein
MWNNHAQHKGCTEAASPAGTFAYGMWEVTKLQKPMV